MANFCNVDGRICPESEAVVPVLDRGFLFGDSVYEVIRTRNGNLFAWREHLDRLRESAAGIGMALSLDDAGILRRVVDTMRAAGNQEHYVRIVVTRGDGTAPSIDLRTAKGRERWIVFARALPPAPTDVRLKVIERLRNDRRALDPAVKSGNYLNNVLGLAEAQQQGATDCLFLNAQGFVTEASTSNVFVVRGGEWITPPLHAGILSGVTRALLLEWLRANGERATERDLVRDDVVEDEGRCECESPGERQAAVARGRTPARLGIGDAHRFDRFAQPGGGFARLGGERALGLGFEEIAHAPREERGLAAHDDLVADHARGSLPFVTHAHAPAEQLERSAVGERHTFGYGREPRAQPSALAPGEAHAFLHRHVPGHGQRHGAVRRVHAQRNPPRARVARHADFGRPPGCDQIRNRQDAFPPLRIGFAARGRKKQG